MKKPKITILSPYGCCQGVMRAINTVKTAHSMYKNKKIYILGPLVHNQEILKELLNDNTQFIKESDVSNLENNSIVVIPAHGVFSQTLDVLQKRQCIVFDATCPFIKNNISIVDKALSEEKEIIYIGKSEHQECKSMLSKSSKIHIFTNNILNQYYFNTNIDILVINQTTYNKDLLKEAHTKIKDKIKRAKIINTTCSETLKRQNNIENIPDDADLIIIVGDVTSSNTNELFNIVKTTKPMIKSILVLNKNELPLSLIKEKKNIYITSGASTPTKTVDDIKDYIISLFS